MWDRISISNLKGVSGWSGMKTCDRFAGALEVNHGERENTRNQQLKPTVNIPLPKPIQPRSTSPMLSLSNDPKKRRGKIGFAGFCAFNASS
jgi:hypothetical protein